MIRIHVLDGCDKCNNFKQALDNLKIKYKVVSCEKDPNECDKIELLTETETYPMAILDGEEIAILYITNKFEDLGKKIKKGSNIALFPFYSIDNMLLYIKNRLN